MAVVFVPGDTVLGFHNRARGLVDELRGQITTYLVGDERKKFEDLADKIVDEIDDAENLLNTIRAEIIGQADRIR